MSAASLRISSGDLLLPHDASWLDLLERELLGFPNTRHDDQADAVAQLLNWQNVPIEEIATAVVASGPMLSFVRTAVQKSSTVAAG